MAVVDDDYNVLGASRRATPTGGGPPDVAAEMEGALRDAAGNPIAGSNPALVANCPAGQSRILRFVGSNPSGSGPGLHVPVPLPNAFVFTACQGSALTES